MFTACLQFQINESQITNAESYFAQRYKPEEAKSVSSITHEQVQNRVNEIKSPLPNCENIAKSLCIEEPKITEEESKGKKNH